MLQQIESVSHHYSRLVLEYTFDAVLDQVVSYLLVDC